MTRSPYPSPLIAACAIALGTLLAACRSDHITAGPAVPAVSTPPGVAADTDIDLSGSLPDLEVRVDGAFTVLPLTTPDGSGQAVHPDYAFMPGWVSPQFLVATPYTGSNSAVENPSLFSESPGFDWLPAEGINNPIAMPAAGYLSDPDIVALPDRGELWVYYRQASSTNTIHLIRSSDGVTFTAPQTVVEGPNQTIISPAVVRRDSTHWLMWSVNGGGAGCSAATTTVELRRSTTGVEWSTPTTVSLVQAGFSPWHIDVQWIPSRHEYWALYNVKVGGSCTTPALYLATSPDGIAWQTYASPVLEHGAIPEFADVVYRSTFAYDPRSDNIRFWYSGARYDEGQFVWRTAYQRRSRVSVFTAIAWGPTRAAASLAGRPGVPLLRDGP